MTILFCHIDWMNDYHGCESHCNQTQSTSNCYYNFQDYNGYCYGFTNEIPQIKTPTLDNILVIWTAKDEYQECPVIVGWYQNATIYATEQIEYDKYAIGRELHYYTKAKSENCVLLSVQDRNFIVPEQSKNDPQFLSSALNYIESCSAIPINTVYTETRLFSILQNPGLNVAELLEAGDDAVDQEEYEKALIFFNTAFHLEKSVDTLFNIASMLQSLFCFDYAIQIFEKLRELEGDSPDTLDNLLNLYLQVNQYEKALQICKLCIDCAEDEEEVCTLLCVQTDIHTQLGQIDRAVACLDFILQHSQDDLMKQEAHHCKHQLLQTECDCQTPHDNR